MEFFGLFGRPNIARLESRGDIARLFRALNHRDSNIRIEAIRAVDRIDSSQLMRVPYSPEQAIRRALDHDTDPSVRIVAAQVLARGGLSERFALLSAAATDPASQVCDAAVEALASFGLRATPELLSLIHESRATARTKQLAMETLQRFQGEVAAEEFVELWWNWKREDLPVVIDARRDTLTTLLAGVQGEQSVEVLARLAARDDSGSSPLYEALAKTKRPEAFDALVSLWEASPAPRDERILKALRSLGDPRTFDLLVNILENPAQYQARARAEAVVALGEHLEDPRTFGVVIGVLDRAEKGKACHADDIGCAGRLLARFGERGIERLLEALKDEREVVRDAAVGGLASLTIGGAKGDIRDASQGSALDPRVRDALASALSDSSFQVRLTAAASFKDLGLEPEGLHERAMLAILREEWGEIEKLGDAAANALALHLRCGGHFGNKASEEGRGFALIGKMGNVKICETLTDIIRQRSYRSILAAGALTDVLSRVHDQLSPESLYEMLTLGNAYVNGPDPDFNYSLDCKAIREGAKDELSRRGLPLI